MKTRKLITDIHSLIKEIMIVNNQFEGQVWWRGQRNSKWGLIPSVSRLPENARSEQNLVSRFRYKAPSRHTQVPSSTDNPGWLFLMQHYRLPTRLLDWSESPLIAAYFATEQDPAIGENQKEINDSAGALFAVSPYMLNETQIGKSVVLLPDDPQALEVINCAFDQTLRDKKIILALRPSEVDVRLMVQLSGFTIHGNGMAFEELPSYDQYLIKWEISAASKRELRSQLKNLGIRESSLFPDLEHLAKDIASSRFKPTSPNYISTKGAMMDVPIRGESST